MHHRLLLLLLIPPLVSTAAAGSGPIEAYYEDIVTTDPDTLRSGLHALIDDHQRFPYTSSDTDTWDVLEEADRDPEDEARIVTVYRNASYPRRGRGNDDYNREHSWPRSYGFPDNDGASPNYPFTDMHHLFLADVAYNEARSNKPFEDCTANCVEWPVEQRGPVVGPYPGRSNWTSGEFTQGQWEVWDGRRGDIARAILYMDLRYEGGAHGVTGASEPDLRLTNDRALIDSARTGRNESVAWMGLLDTLLAWHFEDPPDDRERWRNDTVAAYQGNRNPFIDHPEWVACVYLSMCGLPINPGLNDAWYDPETSGQGVFITVYPEEGLLFLAHFTFDTRPPDSDEGAVIEAPGQRWITAIGPFDGSRAELTATLTFGGRLDDPSPVERQTPYGRYSLEFRDCARARLSYAFDAIPLSGDIELRRVASDNIALCEALSSSPQTPR